MKFFCYCLTLIFALSSPVVILATDAYSSSFVTVDGNHTTIRVESNGHVKTYDSNTTGSVSVQTDNGSARASANVSVGNISPTLKPVIHKFITTSPTPVPSVLITNSFPDPVSAQTPNFVDKILNFFKNLFKIR